MKFFLKKFHLKKETHKKKMPTEAFNLVSAEVAVCVSDMIRKIEEEEHIEQESILEDNRASSINRENFKTLLDVDEVEIPIEE